MIHISHLSAGCHDSLILHDISLSVMSRSLYSLIGPNGSGKTTLLRVLAKLIKYSGSVIINNEEIARINTKNYARLVSFAMSAQTFKPSYPFTALEVLNMSALSSRSPFTFSPSVHERKNIMNAAELLNITHLLNRNILTLSDGQRQLVLVASAIARNTPVLLLDEPASSLDPDKSAHLFRVLRSLADDGRCIIAAVHDVNSSLHYSDGFIALKNGKLHSQGAHINAQILSELYGVEFDEYINVKGRNLIWYVSQKN